MNAKRDPLRIWLTTALASTLLVNFIIVVWLFMAGDTLKDSFRSTAASSVFLMQKNVGTDSWKPMIQAYRLKVDHPGSDMYSIFFTDHVKFQYPPTSLIFFHLIPASFTKVVNGALGQPLLDGLSWLTRIAILLTVIYSTIILEISFNRSRLQSPAKPEWAAGYRALLCLALGLTYFPLMFGYELGQIQVFINALVALAVLSNLKGQDFRAGLCLGACCLMKPQYGVLVLWALVRKKWKFALGFSSIFFVGLAASIICFGWHDHLRYLEVLKKISRQGEVYWPNQSVNGFLNRLLGNGDPVHFSETDYASHHLVVYAGTVISSVAILAMALWPWGQRTLREKDTVDFSIVLMAATLASPITWEHHYGVFLPIFAFAVPMLMNFRPFGRATAPVLVISYVAMAQVMLRPEAIFFNRWTGLLGSHFFFGSLILFSLMLVLRAKGEIRT